MSGNFIKLGDNFHKLIFLLTNSTFCGKETDRYHILCYWKGFLLNPFWHDRKGGNVLYLDCNGWHLGISLYTIREIFESDSFQETPIFTDIVIYRRYRIKDRYL